MRNTLVLFLVSLPIFAMATNNPSDSTLATEEVSVSFYDTARVYMEDWNNDVTFQYPPAGFSPKGTIALVDSTFGYAFPVEKPTTSGFGGRRRHHKGVDIPLEVGENVVAAFGGKVRYAKWNSGGFGNLVIVRHPNGLETFYAHLSKINVEPNQIVQAGELLGLGGSTGRSYSPHLHFEVRYGYVPFDPQFVFDLENYCLKTDTLDLAMVVKNAHGLKCYDVDEYDEHQHDHDHTATPAPLAATASQGTVGARYHIVRSGDTLSKIGAKHGRSVDALCKLNGISSTSILQIGQKIRVR
ncbi:MAG: M23 family metallopeptidase [bacterium]|nr:M23 family metallopeptidase [bacterium]